jgi:hypothetical protein
MNDGGDGDHGYTLNRSVLNIVVLKSSLTAVGMSSLRLDHANPGLAAAYIDNLTELFKNVDMHIIVSRKPGSKDGTQTSELAYLAIKVPVLVKEMVNNPVALQYTSGSI